MMRRVILILALLASLALWIWVELGNAYDRGWEAHQQKVSSQVAEEVERRYQMLKANLDDSRKRDQELILKLQRSNRHQDSLIAELNQHLEDQQMLNYHMEEKPNGQIQTVPLLGGSVLDDHTVRLLNAARAGIPAEREPGGAAGRGDEKGRALAFASPPVTGAEFAENDLQVVRLYHQLAARHDTLVDWVNQQCTRKTAHPQ